MSRFFDLLGAPLANARWSWGARGNDGTVFLRQWETDVFTDDGREFVAIAYDDRFPGPTEHGWRERLTHIEAIRSGAPCRIVVVAAQDPSAAPRRIRTFDARHIIVGGELVVKRGKTCVAVTDRRPV